MLCFSAAALEYFDIFAYRCAASEPALLLSVGRDGGL